VKKLSIVQIKTNILADVEDIIKIEQDLKTGQVVFCRTDEFFNNYEEDVITLKQSIDRLRNLCSQLGGSMARFGEDILILSPNSEITLDI
jgi:SepF-like predicted cell division protein (DUF552 family)